MPWWTGCLFGCGILGLGSDKSLPEVWVIPEVPIRFEGKLVPGDERIPRIREFLEAVNARIYDATDGQVRIAKFVVRNAEAWPETAPGTGTLREVRSNRGTGTIGLPRTPGYFYFSLPESWTEKSYCAGVAAHEWFHAWIGLYDEYGNGESCPEKWLDRMNTDSCIMDNCWRTELCRPRYHNEDTIQHQKRGMSCYEWLRKAVRDAGYGEILVPEKFLTGSDVPEMEVEFRIGG